MDHWRRYEGHHECVSGRAEAGPVADDRTKILLYMIPHLSALLANGRDDFKTLTSNFSTFLCVHKVITSILRARRMQHATCDSHPILHSLGRSNFPDLALPIGANEARSQKDLTCVTSFQRVAFCVSLIFDIPLAQFAGKAALFGACATSCLT